MKTIPLIVIGLICMLAGCSTTTPNYDARFGDSVRNAKQKMIINPDANKNPDPVIGMDAKAAGETIINYHDTFKSPPPAVNVINIGGGISTGK